MKIHRSCKLNIRGESNSRKIEGRAIVYNVETRLWDDVYEIIKPGAATEVLARVGSPRHIHLVSSHEMTTENILASTRNGSLKLEEDGEGVRFEAVLEEDERSDAIYRKIKSGLLDQMSFCFYARAITRELKKDNSLLRIIKNIEEITEISVVVNAAYPTAKVNARGYSNDIEDYKKIERENFILEEKKLQLAKGGKYE